MNRTELASVVARIVESELPSPASRDFCWTTRLLAETGLSPGLTSLIGLEASFGTKAPERPCHRTLLKLLDAAPCSDGLTFALRESVALAMEARQMARDARWDPPGRSLPGPAEAIAMLLAEVGTVRQLAADLARHNDLHHRLVNC